MDFYFVDERGNDSTNFETITNKGQIEKYKIASKYFQIGVLKINSKNLFLFQEHLNCIRYFLNISKELERLLSSKNALSKLWAIIESTFYNIECRYLSGFICKENYNGPYLYNNRHRFRIFNIGRILEYTANSYHSTGSVKAQIIVDRFSMTEEKEVDAMFYFKNKLSNYYQEVQIAFIDSRCCDYLQIIDVVISVIDEKILCQNKKFGNWSTAFVDIVDFS